jgi:hypothetical protein
VSEESKQVNVPILLLTGNKDEFVNLESVVKSTEYVQKFSLKIVDGASHFPHQELPDTVNRMLLTFLVGEHFMSCLLVDIILQMLFSCSHLFYRVIITLLTSSS